MWPVFLFDNAVFLQYVWCLQEDSTLFTLHVICRFCGWCRSQWDSNCSAFVSLCSAYFCFVNSLTKMMTLDFYQSWPMHLIHLHMTHLCRCLTVTVAVFYSSCCLNCSMAEAVTNTAILFIIAQLCVLFSNQCRKYAIQTSLFQMHSGLKRVITNIKNVGILNFSKPQIY